MMLEADAMELATSGLVWLVYADGSYCAVDLKDYCAMGVPALNGVKVRLSLRSAMAESARIRRRS